MSFELHCSVNILVALSWLWPIGLLSWTRSEKKKKRKNAFNSLTTISEHHSKVPVAELLHQFVFNTLSHSKPGCRWSQADNYAEKIKKCQLNPFPPPPRLDQVLSLYPWHSCQSGDSMMMNFSSGQLGWVAPVLKDTKYPRLWNLNSAENVTQFQLSKFNLSH